jgi:hypothetical protein
MSDARDISRLFSQLGDSGAGYRELAKDARAVSAEERWPLLGSVRVDQAKTAPPAANGDLVAQSAPRGLAGRPGVAPRPEAGNTRNTGSPESGSREPEGAGLAALFARLAGEEGARDGAAPPPSLFRRRKAL